MEDLSLFKVWKWLREADLLSSLVLLGTSVLAALGMHLIFRFVLHKIAQKSQNRMDDELVNMFHRPMVFTALLVGVMLTLEDLGLPKPWGGRGVALIQSVLGLMWTVTLLRLFKRFLAAVRNRRKGDSVAAQALPFLENLAQVVIMIACGIWLLDLWQINITPLLASAGIATAAVALASKDTLANFFGGMSIMIDRPYRLGDYVVLDNQERGEVVHIGIRSTRLLTRDDVLITIPNAVMANARIVNQTAPAPRFRVRCKLGVSYDADPDQVERVLLASIQGLEKLLNIPTPRVRFRSFGDSALNFELLAWVADPGDRGLAEHLINKRVYYALKEAGIEIPFPQRVVRLQQDR